MPYGNGINWSGGPASALTTARTITAFKIGWPAFGEIDIPLAVTPGTTPEILAGQILAWWASNGLPGVEVAGHFDPMPDTRGPTIVFYPRGGSMPDRLRLKLTDSGANTEVIFGEPDRGPGKYGTRIREQNLNICNVNPGILAPL